VIAVIQHGSIAVI